MAQGKMKVKSVNMQKKSKHQSKKGLGPKKGGKRNIAPKKAQKVKEKNIREVLQKSINKSIERELASRAGSSSLAVVKAPVDKSKKEEQKK